ncbi:cytochrome P450 CYP12A2-like isoform X2 [Sitophilus oryzae]|uniref:Cytochrome P450 CYP12A2-like isoform X2 n=1 Tax=Sitophilus oryzae TaxID=7048 RepID=A0A6J2X3J4_SITOR|nr:cytochrome P450 CYP12A2-like isoform X2 [Sitophilus oryzae]
MRQFSINGARSVIKILQINRVNYATEAKAAEAPPTAAVVDDIPPTPVIIDVKKAVETKPIPKIKLAAVDAISIPKNISSFDAVPGPNTLRIISKMWTYVPSLSTEFTAGALFQVMNLGKFFGNLLSWGGNTRFFQKFFNVYGPVVRLHGPFGGDVVLLSRPEHASLVFKNEGKQPVRACLDSVEKYRLEHRRLRQAGPFLMSGSAWEKIHESLEQPLKSSVDKYFKTIDNICDQFVERTLAIRNLQDEMPKTFKDEILKWCLECMCAVTLNRKFGFLDPTGLSPTSDPGRILDSVNCATDAIRKCEFGFHIWKFIDTPSWRSLVKNCDSIDSILSKYVERAQSALREKKDLKPHINDFSMIDRLLLNEDILIEDAMTVLLDMFIIGANATAHSVAFLLYHLSKSPKCQKKVQEEIARLPQRELSAADLKKMTYLQACIKESLRLAPPIPILNRILAENTVIHKYFIPKGTYVLIAAHLASLREEYFEDAHKFRPERWLSQEVGVLAKELQEFATMPFGHGPRSCQARELAETEVALLTVKLLKKFNVEYNYGEVSSSNLMLASPTKPLNFTFFDRQ